MNISKEIKNQLPNKISLWKKKLRDSDNNFNQLKLPWQKLLKKNLNLQKVFERWEINMMVNSKTRKNFSTKEFNKSREQSKTQIENVNLSEKRSLRSQESIRTLLKSWEECTNNKTPVLGKVKKVQD